MHTSSHPSDYRTPLTTRRQKYLNQIGLTEIAQRTADCEAYWHWLKTEDPTDNWREQLYTSMVRTDLYYAKRMAAEDEKRYAAFEGCIRGEYATRLDFRFHTAKTTIDAAAHREHQAIVREIRRVIAKLIPVTIHKLTAYRDASRRYNRTVKAIHAGVISTADLIALQAALPTSVSVSRRMFHAASFSFELHDWALADLPDGDEDRSDLELLLHGLRQTGYAAIPADTRAQFAIEPEPPIANYVATYSFDELTGAVTAKVKGQRRVPVSPRTRRPARFMSLAVDFHVQFEDLTPDMWIEIPPEQ